VKDVETFDPGFTIFWIIYGAFEAFRFGGVWIMIHGQAASREAYASGTETRQDAHPIEFGDCSTIAEYHRAYMFGSVEREESRRHYLVPPPVFGDTLWSDHKLAVLAS
jgi:hypothetical protein